ncbi:MAG: aliphatic sulfonate ABC transporter substrate-binding protein [Methanosarcinales archaeon]|nr:MAG: aliphatic sulfonate ABC transporter substrate-binding protein [Methanosarcinales archaeon]
MKKRMILSLTATVSVALVAIFAGCVDEKTPSEMATLYMGYQPINHHTAAMLASEKGWWEKDLAKFGIEKVEMKEFPSGPPEMHAMLAGDLDVAYVGMAPPISAMYEGLDAKLIAGVETGGDALIIRSDLVDKYKEPQSLKGMTIATYPPGSIPHTILSKWLLDNGIDPEKDVNIKGMGPSDAVTAIGAKAIDAAFICTPYPSMIEEAGYGTIVIVGGEMCPNHACCCLVASGEMISEHPDIVKQIIKIHIRATNYINEHPEEAAEIFGKRYNINVKTIMHSLNVTSTRWIHDPHAETVDGLEYARVIYELNKERYEGSGVKVLEEEDIFDTSFYDEIK